MDASNYMSPGRGGARLGVYTHRCTRERARYMYTRMHLCRNMRVHTRRYIETRGSACVPALSCASMYAYACVRAPVYDTILRSRIPLPGCLTLAEATRSGSHVRSAPHRRSNYFPHGRTVAYVRSHVRPRRMIVSKFRNGKIGDPVRSDPARPATG